MALCGSVSLATPHLLASKMILNEFVVEGKDLTIQYTVFNVGTRWVLIRVLTFVFCFTLLLYALRAYSPAQLVTLEDDSFPKEEFVPVSGLLSTKWERINQYLIICTYCSSCVCVVCVCMCSVCYKGNRGDSLAS